MGESQGAGGGDTEAWDVVVVRLQSFMVEMRSEDFVIRGGGARRLKAGQERQTREPGSEMAAT